MAKANSKRGETIAQLESHLAALEQELAAVKAAGESLDGYWVDSAVSKGHRYYRLRRHRGQDKSGKERSPECQVLDDSEVEAIKAKCDRGKKIKKLERQIVSTRTELEEKRSIARELGLL